jgi:hypothetical protein
VSVHTFLEAQVGLFLYPFPSLAFIQGFKLSSQLEACVIIKQIVLSKNDDDRHSRFVTADVHEQWQTSFVSPKEHTHTHTHTFTKIDFAQLLITPFRLDERQRVGFECIACAE